MLSDNAVMLLLRSAVLAGGIGLSEKETKKKLLESAKKEFLEKGYMHASLRNICKNAGVTTGHCIFSSGIKRLYLLLWWMNRCRSFMIS